MSRKAKGKAYCVAFGCLNNNKDSNLTFFTLPKESERRRKWLTLIHREDLLQREGLKRTSHVVCSAHFEDSSIKIIKHLKENALPSKHLPNQPQEGPRSAAQPTSRLVIDKVTVLSENVIREGPSCSVVQSTPESIQGTSKRKLILLSNNIEHVTVGTQIEALGSMEERRQISKSPAERTPRTRRLSDDLCKRRIWLTLIHREDLLQRENLKSNSYVVCAAHFEQSSIKIIQQLKENAVPSKHLPNQPKEDSSRSAAQPASTRVKMTVLSDDIIREGPSCSEAQPASTRVIDKVTVLSDNVIKEGTSCSAVQPASTRVIDKVTVLSDNVIKEGTSCSAVQPASTRVIDKVTVLSDNVIKEGTSCSAVQPASTRVIDKVTVLSDNVIKEGTSCSAVQPASTRVIDKVTVLSDNVIREGSSCSVVQSTPESIKGTSKRKLILLSNKKEHVTVGTQIEILGSMEERRQTSMSLAEGKRKLSDELRNQGDDAILKAATTIRGPCTVCCVFGCRNSVREQPDKFYFAFPTQPERYLSWLKLINRGDLADKLGAGQSDQRVCSDHFDAGDFDGVSLRADATPHLNLPAKSHVEIIEYADCGEGLDGIKIEAPEDPDAMEVEIQFEPEAPPTVSFNEPVMPVITRVQSQNVSVPTNKEVFDRRPAGARVTPMNIENVDIPPTRVNENHSYPNPKVGIPVPHKLAAALAGTDPLKTRHAFFKNATISSIEHISLPIDGPVEKKSVLVQTTKDLIDKWNEPMKKKYATELREAKDKLRKVENAFKNSRMDEKKFLMSCDKYLDEKIANIVKSHASLLEKSKGNRYSQNFKAFAVNLYLCSPQSYRFVQQFFYLPSMTTVHRYQPPVRTGFNENLMQSLKLKVDQMSEKEKICTVCFDYMEVNKNLYYDVRHDFVCGLHEIDQVQGIEPAKYAPVIMVRGLYAKWKQPVSFALVAEKKCYPEIKQWLYKTIAILLDLGFNVKAFTANQETEFLDFSDISVTESFFEVCGRKIYQFYDVPYLFKSARDDFMKYDFCFGSKLAKLSHVLEVYDVDKQQELRLMPKITDQHLRPVDGSENDIKLSVELFSRAVAAALHFHVNANFVHSSTADTVEFIQLMNNLFDILNSLKTSNDYEFKKAYKGTDEQNRFLQSAIEYLQQLQMVDAFGNLIEKRTFVTGLLITVTSLVRLLQDLEMENLKYIHTKYLSKDCMEGYFKRVRELAGTSNARPTSIMFARSFRRLFLVNLVSNAKKGGTEIDLKSTLAKISAYVKLDVDWKKEDEDQNRSLSVGVSDYQQLWPVPPNYFVAGYLLWKCLEKHKCEPLVDNLCRMYLMEVNADALMEKFKAFHGNNMKRKELPPVPYHFTHFVNRLAKIFEEFSVMPGVDMFGFGRFIYSKMEEETFEVPCECFPLMFVKFLFIRIKIFHMMKEYNFKNRPTRRSRAKK